jgi:hypothetical protein
VQLCYPEHFSRHSVHVTEAGQLERWLQGREGQGYCAAIKEGGRSIALRFSRSNGVDYDGIHYQLILSPVL